MRTAPLGYVVLDGAIYCCAGFGETTAWYRNVLADPSVEVVLPGRTLGGKATPVSAPDEWIRAYRALIASLGVVGRLTVGDVRGLDDADLLAVHGGIPLVRIEPTAFVPGPLDPGGRILARVVGGIVRPRRRSGRATRPASSLAGLWIRRPRPTSLGRPPRSVSGYLWHPRAQLLSGAPLQPFPAATSAPA